MNKIEARWNVLIEESGELSEQFMQPRLYNGEYHWIDGVEGCQLFAGDFFSKEGAIEAYEAVHGEVHESETKSGYYARMTAGGYMDCTEYTPINDEADVESFFEMYDLLPEEGSNGG